MAEFRDNGDCVRARLYSYSASMTGWKSGPKSLIWGRYSIVSGSKPQGTNPTGTIDNSLTVSRDKIAGSRV